MVLNVSVTQTSMKGHKNNAKYNWWNDVVTVKRHDYTFRVIWRNFSFTVEDMYWEGPKLHYDITGSTLGYEITN